MPSPGLRGRHETACHKRRQGEQKAAADKAFGQFLYDTDDGILSWDADGSGGGVAVTIALFPDTPALTAADFQIVV